MDWKNFSDKELEEIESGRLPLSIHPHYPFVFIDLILRQDTPPLITLWTLRSELLSQLVPKWCEMAKTYYWARKECDELREYLIRSYQEIQEPLRRLTKWPRPAGRSQPNKTAEYFLLGEIARLLIDDGYSDSEANAAVGLAIAKLNFREKSA